MKNLFSKPSKIIRSSKLVALLLFGTILVSGCGSKEGNTGTDVKVGSNSIGVVGAIFWAPRVEISGTVFTPAYYYFYSEDYCFIMYGGTTSGFIKPYTKTESSVKIKFGTGKGEITYQLLGNKVLTNDGRSFFRVDDFTSAFQCNK